MEVPALIFDKFWRSKYATEKYVKNILTGKIDFSGKYVLDFGCGTGSYSFLFDSDKYLGIDTNGKRILYAQKHYPQYKFQKIDASGIKSEKNKFDYIFIISVLHHLNDNANRKNIKLFSEILKEDGAIIGMEPCLFPNSKHAIQLSNWFMKSIDRGKFIRTEQGYQLLFKDLFAFKTQKRYTRHFIYNELFYIACKS